MIVNALTMLNEYGDVTICWGEDQNDKMVPIIEKKMKEGVTFMIIERRLDGLPDDRRKLTDPKEAMRYRALSISDDDFVRFVESGSGIPTKTPDAPTKTVRRAKTAREVAENETVGVRQRRGG